MGSLKEYFKEIDEYVSSFSESVPYFRGVNKGNYNLVPSLFRNHDKLKDKRYKTTTLENNLYYDFTSYGNGILDVQDDWDILFKMQHYGLPTRLLDWTESLGVALYFALNYSDEIEDPCIWVLNPYALNDDIEKDRKLLFTDRVYRTLYNPKTDFKDSYYNYFIVNHSKNKEILFKKPQALYPVKSNQRVRAQWGVFTIHGLNEDCLSKQVSETIVRKFPIPEVIIEEARLFLQHASINHFSVMPDLDGLKKYIQDYYFTK